MQPRPPFDGPSLPDNPALWIRGQRVLIEDDPGGTIERAAKPLLALKANPLIAAHLQTKSSNAIGSQAISIQPALSLSAVTTAIMTQTQLAMRTQLRRHDVDALMPCQNFSLQYREERSGLTQAVGCLDAFSLGRAALQCYSEITELTDSRYRVFRSLQQPGRFLIVPASYAIARFPADHGERAYRPALTLYAALDPSNDRNNRVVYRATLEPVLPVNLRRSLLTKLQREAPSPIIDLPTAIPADVDCAWTIGSALGVEATTLKTPEGFQVALTCDVASALLLKELIEAGDLRGQARFRIPDGSSLDTSLSLDLTAVTGPWSSGPVEVLSAGSNSLLRNRAEVPVEVSSVCAYRNGTLVSEVEVASLLQRDGERAISLPEADEAFANSTTQPGVRPAIEEIRAMIEQVRVNLLFIDLIDYAAHGLRAIEVEARSNEQTESTGVEMVGQPARGSLDFLLPLTRYVGDPTLQFRVTKVFESGEPVQTSWIGWNLATAGNVVSLTWEMVD